MFTNENWGLCAELQEKIYVSKNECKKPFSSLLMNPNAKCPSKVPQSLLSSALNSPHKNDEQGTTKVETCITKKIISSQLVQGPYAVEVQQKDPNSPLYSVKSFEELKLQKELLKGVYGMGFNFPSKIQETALPILLVDPPQNMIAQSQSGTGKTAAFVLACLSRIDAEKMYPQVLILLPTFELAEQIGNVAKNMAKFCSKIKFCFVVRGQVNFQKITAQFLIGTPGKVLDWALKFKYFDIKKISIFVLDEADVMISTQGHQDQSIRISKNLSPDCQILLFSATYSEEVIEFANLIVSDPITIRLRREEESMKNIKQYYIDVSLNQEDNDCIKQKCLVIQNIYGIMTIGQSIIFCRTRKTAGLLSQMLISEGYTVSVLSAELTIDQRVAVLNRFREGKEKVLITTNVCARGIDIEQVNVVINFDMPVDKFGNADCETYLHRIGRSGRFGKPGSAINMIDGPISLHILKTIENHFGVPIHKIIADDIDVNTFDTTS